ncbi:MAG: hypothetical protein M3Q07_09430 [Pseudobdellovibrionaceae bacterium]|nr:hypothetical protein [Pseudobdellovibrionaceae bacterium]
MEEIFIGLSGRKVEGTFFEYSEKTSTVKPSALPTKTLILVSTKDASEFQQRMAVIREATGESYFVKELMNTGIGLIEVTLEKQVSVEAITHGKF